MGSQSFSDDAHFTPRSQPSVASHKSTPHAKLVQNGTSRSQSQQSFEGRHPTQSVGSLDDR